MNNGNNYEGYWKNGNKEGEGKEEFKYGLAKSFEGNFKENLKEGFGTFI